MRENLCSTVLICLLLVSGAAALLVLPVSAGTTAGPGGKPVVTIAAMGSQGYYLGEKVTLSGQNTASDTTYLFLTGPNVPAGGAGLTSPHQAAVSGSPGTFTAVKTLPDKTWAYSYYTSGLLLDAGSYTLYAVSSPVTLDQFGDSATYGSVSVIIKRPFISAEVEPQSVARGQSFSVTGTAEGVPPDVQVWILGPTMYSRAIQTVNADASFRYEVSGNVTANLGSGQYFVVVQHPMRNNRFDIDVSGEYVRSMQGTGTSLFRISGPGSLQGPDAADALAAAINMREAHDETGTNDTYTILPFRVTDTSGSTGITIAADGTQSYYLGEKVVFRGRNAGSDTTYLFLTGPNLPAAGAKLTSPREPVVSGNAGSFTSVKTQTDRTWEYTWYTANLPLDAGTYSVYAESRPDAKDPAGPAGAAGVGIIVKKPFISAAISPSTVTAGQQFTVNGTAEGDPPSVQIWIFGNNFVYTAKPSVNADASFTFRGDAAISGRLPAGQNYLVVQHSMQNNRFDIDMNGDNVRNENLNSTILFRVSGPGSLQGGDAADALVTAFSDPGMQSDDTYTIIPFQVASAGSPAVQAAVSPAATTGTARSIPIEYAAPIGVGAIVVMGIVLWKRQ